MKKIFRSRDDKLVGGVCGGIGEYFDIDPTLVRLLVLLIALISLVGSIFSSIFAVALVYLLAWLIIPEEKEKHSAPAAANSSPKLKKK